MKKTFLSLAILTAGTAAATPFTGNDTKSSAMGNTGVASADSFAASQFNPALLAAYGGDVNFGLQLPSAKLAIDDGRGFVQHTNEFFVEGDVIADFENIDAARVQTEIEGDGGSVESLADVVDGTNQAAQDLADAVENGSGVQQASDDLNTETETLNTKIDTIQVELGNVEVAIDNTSDGVEGYQDRPLNILGSIGTAIAIPRSGLGLAMHLNNNASLGMQADISENDLAQISAAVSDTSGYTDEAQELTTLTNDLSQKAATLADMEQSDTGFEAAYNDFVLAQGALDAETNAQDSTVTLYNDTNETVNYDGNNVDTYTSANGYFDDGEFQSGATAGFGDESTITVLGANVLELGISAAREFTYLGQTFSAGVTPKLQSITIFEDTIQLNNAEEEVGDDPVAYLSSNTTSVFTGNLDLGLAKNWYNVAGGTVRGGLVVKDLIPQTFESQSGRELEMGPKMRIGAAHQTRWTTVAADLDITENEPLGYGVPSRYLGLGGELNAFGWMKVRAGYRNNLSIEDSHVVTTGLGFTPFGVGLDFSGWFKPKSFDEWDEIIQDAGLSAQFSMEF